MKLLNILIISLFSVSFLNANVDNAFKLCRIMDNIGTLSKPCEVSGWDSSVSITLDISSYEAIVICRLTTQKMQELGLTFDRGWTLKIYSPYSNGNTIAMFKLGI